ncbi:tRNA (N6-isopentenyl adenosine(37)-C2)-methylthiotransferase MiaB [Deinococcus radiodurans]|jgi:tRNA-i(6)A37 thiotransferase enzyme MiaB|nr:tRNA (N6-isopentenyl adenosine(37)-C2)-methylthiotransferase MiaB [Deinococcus radiodurans]ANC71676.1 tRNA (N6-isopentenyl adenosine(37)-C2)-methylthiotransferase MiaB [Deinococcus radiodurans R1 = ATCC 13939 = DSM 20539]QEM70633.1 tRNA (N6-isopentenyl adenosine(37)-C2)-methylthiotransferase MiaB [Deinococcus radiodurans]QIP29233.1 tRNA (N6-isopentenyl adenosine(37)-C2)-methylthiotransferase MiaB [Deinococcus radiodurans]QIP32074.1 tRNA (N6-isopentenyl adenosine(37)-C2)-methylthiotransferase
MKAHLITYGCQMNEYDTHLVQSQLVSFGADIVESPDEADFVLVNTCAVRGKPVDKVRSLLGDLRKQKAQRSLVVGMMGCLAQLEEGQQIARKFEVDVLLGPGSLLDIGAALESNERFWGLQFKDELHDHIPPPPSGKLQAHLTIMRGCDHHCTYCIVPTTRGPQVSRHPDDILRELDMQLAAGVREVTLLGQNVNAYGVDQGAKLKGYPSFADLLRMVGASGIERVKFTTSHPMNFTEDVAAAIGETPAICEFVHLPVQSGSDRVLRRMAREYNREKYLTHIAQIKKHIPDVVLATDIIVGFPGETEEDFQDTLSLYDEVGYDSAYMFIYSPRPGTPSYKHFQDLPRELKTERLQRLIARQKDWSARKNAQKVGTVQQVLLRGDAHDAGFLEGHTRGNHPTVVPKAIGADGAGVYQVRIDHATPHMMYGHILGPDGQPLPEQPRFNPEAAAVGGALPML